MNPVNATKQMLISIFSTSSAGTSGFSRSNFKTAVNYKGRNVLSDVSQQAKQNYTLDRGRYRRTQVIPGWRRRSHLELLWNIKKVSNSKERAIFDD